MEMTVKFAVDELKARPPVLCLLPELDPYQKTRVIQAMENKSGQLTSARKILDFGRMEFKCGCFGKGDNGIWEEGWRWFDVDESDCSDVQFLKRFNLFQSILWYTVELQNMSEGDYEAEVFTHGVSVSRQVLSVPFGTSKKTKKIGVRAVTHRHAPVA